MQRRDEKSEGDSEIAVSRTKAAGGLWKRIVERKKICYNVKLEKAAEAGREKFGNKL